MSTHNVLFELGTEELPAGEQVGMAQALATGICQGLEGECLTFDNTQVFATPRRLAVLISGVSEKAEDTEQEVLGPPITAAKNSEGEWTPAALGFAKKQGVSADELQTITTDKGDRLGLLARRKGAVCADVLPVLVAQAVSRIPVSKRMRWGRERHEFLRPVQWCVLLLGDKVLPLSVFGLESSNESRGHRFHGAQSVKITHANQYVDILRGEFVIADPGERRNLIQKQVEALVTKGETVIIDEGLLDEVTGLVEWPVALRGSFDDAFLSVPRQALISSMREHQKYFHMENTVGDLLPAFITVSNIESNNPQAVIYGNEKVIRPRLADAAFFFDTDKQTSLASKADRLKDVLFQQDLGTLADKQRRISSVAASLSEALGADSTIVAEAGSVIKADLVSDMVGEFPELQGIAGRHYALHDGMSGMVADAVEQHYWPKFSGDQLPITPEAAALALADRLDSLVGIFGIGQTPTGSKDPFALRRASLAVIRILLQFAPKMNIDALIDVAKAPFEENVLGEDTASKVRAYLLERLPAHYEEQGVSLDILRAVTVVSTESLGDIDGRALALQEFAGSDAAMALSAANKRVANILAKAEASIKEVDTALLVEGAEQALAQSLDVTRARLDSTLDAEDYAGALQELAGLRNDIDKFFDEVLVNAEDLSIRRNRLALLSDLRSAFLKVADLAVLAR